MCQQRWHVYHASQMFQTSVFYTQCPGPLSDGCSLTLETSLGKRRCQVYVFPASCDCVCVWVCVNIHECTSLFYSCKTQICSQLFSHLLLFHKCVVYDRYDKPWVFNVTEIDMILLIEVKRTPLRYWTEIYANNHCLLHRKEKTGSFVFCDWASMDKLQKINFKFPCPYTAGTTYFS